MDKNYAFPINQNHGLKETKLSRLTASKYLDLLVSMKLLKKEKLGRTNYYINQALFSLFTG